MMVSFDADYKDIRARVAAVLFEHWQDEAPLNILHAEVEGVVPYVAGEFYKRELPGIIQLIDAIAAPIDLIFVDGYVSIDAKRKGLGAYLHEYLDRKIPVIGVAKNKFVGATTAIEVQRGSSQNPLQVTAAGIAVEVAARMVQQMHGSFRLPTLLKMTDQAARSW